MTNVLEVTLEQYVTKVVMKDVKTNSLINMGFVDVYRYFHPQKNEYSWVGRTGYGYRYDYCFVSTNYINRIVNCGFIHETRNYKLTDHSAFMVEISLL